MVFKKNSTRLDYMMQHKPISAVAQLKRTLLQESFESENLVYIRLLLMLDSYAMENKNCNFPYSIY